jgi:phage terminase large subunit-like protein
MAEAIITAYNRHEANIIVGEVNNGGDLSLFNFFWFFSNLED